VYDIHINVMVKNIRKNVVELSILFVHKNKQIAWSHMNRLIYYILFVFCFPFCSANAQSEIARFQSKGGGFINGSDIVMIDSSDSTTLSIDFYSLENASYSEFKSLNLQETNSEDYEIVKISSDSCGCVICALLEHQTSSSDITKVDKLSCYKEVAQGWINVLKIDEIPYKQSGYTSNFEFQLSESGNKLIISSPDLESSSINVTEKIITQFYNFNPLDNRFEIIDEKEMKIYTNSKIKLSLHNDKIFVSPNIAIGFYENQFIQYNQVDV